MPYTTVEALSQLPSVLMFLQLLQAEVEKLPKDPEPVSVEAYGNLAAALAPAFGKIVDEIRADIAD